MATPIFTESLKSNQQVDHPGSQACACGPFFAPSQPLTYLHCHTKFTLQTLRDRGTRNVPFPDASLSSTVTGFWIQCVSRPKPLTTSHIQTRHTGSVSTLYLPRDYRVLSLAPPRQSRGYPPPLPGYHYHYHSQSPINHRNKKLSFWRHDLSGISEVYQLDLSILGLESRFCILKPAKRPTPIRWCGGYQKGTLLYKREPISEIFYA